MKKGFTLMELLAVIVILAIIALITIPTILSVLEKANESTILESAQLYLNAVEQSIMTKGMEDGVIYTPDICIIEPDGNLICDRTESLEVVAKGEKASDGEILFENGKIIDVQIVMGKRKIIKSESGELVFGGHASICRLVEGEPRAIGSKYQCKVKDNMEDGYERGYYFYLLSHNFNGTVNLIMDSNITSDGKIISEEDLGIVSWNNTQGNGPVAAMSYLYNATKDWINVPNMTFNYKDENINPENIQEGEYGYGSISAISTSGTSAITNNSGATTFSRENFKVRLPMFYELYGDDKCPDIYDSCPSWLTSNLNISDGDNTVYGYWTLTSVYESDAYIITDMLTYDSVWMSEYGVRPVITVKVHSNLYSTT